MASADDGIEEGRLDLVPMIDCIMLLLIFFVMTTKFSSEEKAISSLLPTDKGQSGAPTTKLDKPQFVNICIYPAGLIKGYQPSDYFAQLKKAQATGQVIGNAWLRIGNRDPVEMIGLQLKQNAGLAMRQHMDQVHAYIASELEKFEVAGKSRKDQHEVVLHCYSGMSWKFALIAYDAVRAYEGVKSGVAYSGDPAQLEAARAVSFAPPRIRNYDANELGNELYEIVNMR